MDEETQLSFLLLVLCYSATATLKGIDVKIEDPWPEHSGRVAQQLGVAAPQQQGEDNADYSHAASSV